MVFSVNLAEKSSLIYLQLPHFCKNFLSFLCSTVTLENREYSSAQSYRTASLAGFRQLHYRRSAIPAERFISYRKELSYVIKTVRKTKDPVDGFCDLIIYDLISYSFFL